MTTKSPISLLQELCQAGAGDLPVYEWNSLPGIQKGQDYFTCVCTVRGRSYHSGQGYPSKSEAKKGAARLAYEDLIQSKELRQTEQTEYRDPPGEYRDPPGEYRDPPGKYRDPPGEYRDPPGLMLGNESTIAAPKAIVLVDLENIPQAGKYKYPSDVQVIMVLSHNHSYYCSAAGDFLRELPPNILVKVVRSSMKDAADHYLTWLAASQFNIYRGSERPIPDFIIVSRDGAGACTAECLKSEWVNNGPPHVEHFTNLRDLQAALHRYSHS